MHTSVSGPRKFRMRIFWFWRAFYAVAMPFWALMVYVGIVSGDVTSTAMFLVFAGLNGLVLVMSGSYVEVDHTRILLHSPPFGDFAIRWSEVETVETNGLVYVFRGGEKVLTLNPAMGDAGSYTLLRQHLEDFRAGYRIPLERVVGTLAVRARNTRVKRG